METFPIRSPNGRDSTPENRRVIAAVINAIISAAAVTAFDADAAELPALMD